MLYQLEARVGRRPYGISININMAPAAGAKPWAPGRLLPALRPLIVSAPWAAGDVTGASGAPFTSVMTGVT